MKIVFSESAAEDLESIYLFIAADNARAARTVIDRIVASIERLTNFPDMARAGQVDRTREWVIPRLPYIAVYRVMPDDDEIVVLGIFHGARNRPME